MNLQQAERKQAKIKMGLMGPAGSGKTYSALLIAYGMTKDWSRIAVIDTENHSAELYSHLGQYNVVNIGSPYSPEKYIAAINLCEQSGMEVIVIDSISHEWEGSGGILDVHSNMAGNSFTNSENMPVTLAVFKLTVCLSLMSLILLKILELSVLSNIFLYRSL